MNAYIKKVLEENQTLAKCFDGTLAQVISSQLDLALTQNDSIGGLEQKITSHEKRIAEEARQKRLEEERIAKEKRDAEKRELARIAEEARQKRLEEERIAKEKRAAEERELARIAEEARQKRLEEERIAKEKRAAEWRIEDRKRRERKAEEERIRQEEERRIAEIMARQEAIRKGWLLVLFIFRTLLIPVIGFGMMFAATALGGVCFYNRPQTPGLLTGQWFLNLVFLALICMFLQFCFSARQWESVKIYCPIVTGSVIGLTFLGLVVFDVIFMGLPSRIIFYLVLCVIGYIGYIIGDFETHDHFAWANSAIAPFVIYIGCHLTQQVYGDAGGTAYWVMSCIAYFFVFVGCIWGFYAIIDDSIENENEFSWMSWVGRSGVFVSILCALFIGCVTFLNGFRFDQKDYFPANAARQNIVLQL